MMAGSYDDDGWIMCMMVGSYDPPLRQKRNIVIIMTYLLQNVSQQALVYVYVLFFAIAGNVFMCIGINITMVTFSTHFNTTW